MEPHLLCTTYLPTLLPLEGGGREEGRTKLPPPYPSPFGGGNS